MTLLFLFVLVLSSCTFSPLIEVEVVFEGRHAYEEYMDVAYYLEYATGGEVKKLYVRPDEKRMKLKLIKGYNAVFLATPFMIDTPLLGGFYTPGDKKIILKEKEGELSYSLLKAYSYNRSSVESLDYKKLVKDLPPSFNSVKFVSELVEGSFGSFSENDKIPVFLENLTSGYWHSSSSEVRNLFSDGDDKRNEMLYLYPGFYSFYNSERQLELFIHVDDEYNVFKQIRKLENIYK